MRGSNLSRIEKKGIGSERDVIDLEDKLRPPQERPIKAQVESNTAFEKAKAASPGHNQAIPSPPA